jgi:hypothetical protein
VVEIGGEQVVSLGLKGIRYKVVSEEGLEVVREKESSCDV